MNRVIQKDEDGCGCACIAMIARRSYAFVLRRAFNGIASGSNAKQIHYALKRFNIDSPKHLILFKKGESYRELNKIALLHYRWMKNKWHKKGYYHWLVWDGHKVLDPKRRPYPLRGKNVVISSYLPVKRHRTNT